MRPSSNLPALIERYFTVRLMNERNASANTIACYRDSFRQLFTFAQKKLRTQPRLWPSMIWMRLLSARFSLISRRNRASVLGRATCAYPRSAPFSGSRLTRSRLAAP